MLTSIDEALDRSEQDAAVESILISGDGDRGLCAGGDVRLLWGMDEQAATSFWALEYRLNSRIASHPVPIVALMDGIVMGGGMGISMHAKVRVVTERSRLAMPEVQIGLSPDVGGLHRLALAPGEVGTHLALTGGSIGAADGIAIGLADIEIPSPRIPAFIADLERDGLTAAVDRHRGAEPGTSELIAARSWIDEGYAAESVPEILARLDAAALAANGGAALLAAEQIRRASPTAVAVALGAIRNARAWQSLDRVLEQDLRTSVGVLRQGDLHEGIRALVIDKDRAPRWSPSAAEDVDEADVDAILTGTYPAAASNPPK